jgi:hypothetical protein
MGRAPQVDPDQLAALVVCAPPICAFAADGKWRSSVFVRCVLILAPSPVGCHAQEVLVPALPKLEEECFFVAPIGKDGSEERNRSDGVLEFIVARAAKELGLHTVRADQLAEPGQITLQVIEHVLGAKAAVADLTGRNPNVYYELAIRHTAKLPTVLIAEQGEQLPFDIAQMRTIFFCHTDLRSADGCRTDIVRHLRQALDGAVDSPVAASVDLQRLQAGDTVERSIAELVTSVSEVEKGLQNVASEIRYGFHSESRIVRRSAELERELMAQHILAKEMANRLDDLLLVARERKDAALEQMVMAALKPGTTLVHNLHGARGHARSARQRATEEAFRIRQARMAEEQRAEMLREVDLGAVDEEAPEGGGDQT